VTQNNDEWASALGQHSIADLNQLASDTLPLAFRHDAHWTERRTRQVSDRCGTVENVADRLTINDGDEREQDGAIRSQPVHEIRFLWPTRTADDAANPVNVIRPLFADCEQAGASVPGLPIDRQRSGMLMHNEADHDNEF
jgi:hypothetical protein